MDQLKELNTKVRFFDSSNKEILFDDLRLFKQKHKTQHKTPLHTGLIVSTAGIPLSILSTRAGPWRSSPA
jgi:hypothetical protein